MQIIAAITTTATEPITIPAISAGERPLLEDSDSDSGWDSDSDPVAAEGPLLEDLDSDSDSVVVEG